MTKTGISLTCTVVMTLVLSAASAGAKTHPNLPDAEKATRTLDSLEYTAVAIDISADRFKMLSTDSELSVESQSAALTDLKTNINTMGQELRKLETQEEQLPLWEQRAIARTHDLLKDAAVNTENATIYFNSNKPHLLSAEYRDFADRIWQDSERLAQTLKATAEMAKLHLNEQRLNENLDLPADGTR